MPQGQKILIVDDDRSVALTFADILRQAGYDAVATYSGEEAVQTASSFAPNLLLSGVLIGAMNGAVTATKIVELLPDCKVLFVSCELGLGDLLEHLLEPARAKGLNFEIMAKPVPPPELLKRISQLLIPRVMSVTA